MSVDGIRSWLHLSPTKHCNFYKVLRLFSLFASKTIYMFLNIMNSYRFLILQLKHYRVHFDSMFLTFKRIKTKNSQVPIKLVTRFRTNRLRADFSIAR